MTPAANSLPPLATWLPWSLALFANVLTKMLADAFAAKHPAAPSIPDLLHNTAFPDIPNWVIDAVLLLQIALYAFSTQTVPLGSVLRVQTYGFALRASTVVLTHYPPPSPHMGWWGANDLMFSGHTVVLTSLAWTRTGRMCACVGCAAIIFSREHYTADVWVAMVITLLLQRLERLGALAWSSTKE